MLARLLTFLLVGTTAHAGEFFETGGVAIGGYDPVAYVREQRAVAGLPHITATHRGSVFRFKNAENREAFAATPEQFAPQYGGYCAWGASRGYKAVSSPENFSVVDGKLYLNYNAEVKAQWSKDIPGHIARADREWTTVAKTMKVAR